VTSAAVIVPPERARGSLHCSAQRTRPRGPDIDTGCRTRLLAQQYRNEIENSAELHLRAKVIRF
jgi:hypothetical protein